MREIMLSELAPTPSAPLTLLHRSGQVLIKNGEPLSEEILALLKEREVTSVMALEANERLDEVRHALTHVQIDIQNLKTGDAIARAIYDTEGHLLLEAGAKIPASFAESLQRRGIHKIYYRRREEEINAKAGRELRAAIEKYLRGEVEMASPEVRDKIEKVEMPQASAEDLDAAKLAAKIDRLESLEVLPSADAFVDNVRDTRKLGPTSQAEKKTFSNVAAECLDDIRFIYKSLASDTTQNVLAVVERVANRVMSGLVRHRDLLLLCGTAADHRMEDYLYRHALAMAVVAANIGTAMRFGTAQVKAITYGALLADVGMLKVPQNILNKAGKLTPAEYAEVRRHPAFGLDILQSIPRIPAEVPYIVYQYHERSNGSGYPCGKKEVVIHTFARIVGVADIYTALCADRPYRLAKLPYEAMETIVLMCGKRLLNSQVVRGLLACNAMFPVGSYVRLADGRVARTIAANPEDYMRPLVAIIFNNAGQRLPECERLNLLEHKNISVTQALSPKDLQIDDVFIGF